MAADSLGRPSGLALVAFSSGMYVSIMMIQLDRNISFFVKKV
jgi:hypothetical protein